ncbi:1,2-phenylacetyl-CoA epoxidase subunit PaaD [Deinococcus yavapaiensis]|uniref:Ring-1,2-phenylacetyl-CoA epoxidase subunit PaaD n=1 Tax=Deinococcus yavapaiensis KR-236 TaxID=694435 RepID=A0A318SF15_9DEIO|nr:1,2-phenylacetyl-CoA epoxidase subunit PaaD [Deinococcus yavapaiensis]PYE55825.1 ring-1,2-phenylacetyl-CoA epoxidase subunit PaaD [Deinococcus yavapaiensis KR-236]
MTVMLGEDAIWNALSTIADPEIPVVNIVEMGIVREVHLDGDTVTVTMTPTFSGCPALHVMRDDISRTVRSLGLSPRVETVLSPPWSTDWITSEAKGKLEKYGIAPPAPASGTLITLDEDLVRCPKCGSFDTTVKNTFGPTLCKTIHVCNACKEPFEAFKSL